MDKLFFVYAGLGYVQESDAHSTRLTVQTVVFGGGHSVSGFILLKFSFGNKKYGRKQAWVK
jgi:hypothetical protein